MHPLLNHFNNFSAGKLYESPEDCMTLVTDLGLVPKRSAVVPCPKCGGEMGSGTDSRRKIGWRWRCAKRNRVSSKCTGSMNPLTNSFFEHSHLAVEEILSVIVGFVQETTASDLQDTISNWRLKRGVTKKVSWSAIGNFYRLCRGVCEVHASHNFSLGPEKVAVKLVKAYRNQRIPKGSLQLGERIHRFLEDIREVYPGFGKVGKRMKEVDLPTMPIADFGNAEPSPHKRPRITEPTPEEAIADDVPVTEKFLGL